MVVPQAPEAPEVVPPDATDAARAAADAARRAEADRKRADAMRQLALESAFDELAEPGDRNQRAGGPTVDASSNATQVWGPGMGDAELQRYIATVSKLMSEQFHPLPALLHQGYQTKLIVEVDDGGRVLRANVSKSSGNASYDQAAKQAAVAARVVPPPPAKYQDGQPNKYYVTFSDPGS
jgi:TolA protein